MKIHVWSLLIFKYNSRDKTSIWMNMIPIFLEFFWAFCCAVCSVLSPAVLQQEISGQTIDSGAIAEKRILKTSVKTQPKFSQNSVKIQPCPFQGCAPEMCANVAVGSLWPTPLAALTVGDPCFCFITVASLRRPLSWLCKTPQEMCRALTAHHISQPPAWEGCTR